MTVSVVPSSFFSNLAVLGMIVTVTSHFTYFLFVLSFPVPLVDVSRGPFYFPPREA